MADQPEQHYTISHTQEAAEQIRELGREAQRSGHWLSYRKAWEAIVTKLQSAPREWGDPIRHAEHPDGIMYRGILRPLVVHYVLFEQARKVLVYEVGPFPLPSG